jgi:hypothetical protein
MIVRSLGDIAENVSDAPKSSIRELLSTFAEGSQGPSSFAFSALPTLPGESLADPQNGCSFGKRFF